MKLTPIPSTLTTWKRWKGLHPDTLVLSTETGYARDYTVDPYENYHRSPLSFFGFEKQSPLLPEKELVLGIEVRGVRKAYPFRVLRAAGPPLEDTVSGERITVHFDKESEEAYAVDASGARLVGIVSYWFVWHSFHPDTLVYEKE